MLMTNPRGKSPGTAGPVAAGRAASSGLCASGAPSPTSTQVTAPRAEAGPPFGVQEVAEEGTGPGLQGSGISSLLGFGCCWRASMTSQRKDCVFCAVLQVVKGKLSSVNFSSSFNFLFPYYDIKWGPRCFS